MIWLNLIIHKIGYIKLSLSKSKFNHIELMFTVLGFIKTKDIFCFRSTFFESIYSFQHPLHGWTVCTAQGSFCFFDRIMSLRKISRTAWLIRPWAHYSLSAYSQNRNISHRKWNQVWSDTRKDNFQSSYTFFQLPGNTCSAERW